MNSRWLRALPALPPLALLPNHGRSNREPRAVRCEQQDPRQLQRPPALHSCRDYPEAVMMANGWHFAMLRDEERAKSFERALKKVVKPGDVVLDIGAGTGLLSMIAKKLGGDVFACEANTAFAEMAHRIQAANGLTFPIFAKRSQDLEISRDLPQKADVLVGEVLSSSLFGEGILASFRDAHKRLLKPGAVVIPRRARLHFAVVEWDAVYRSRSIGDVCGFDLSAFNAFRAERRLMELPPVPSDGSVRLLTEGTTGVAVDFGDPSDPLLASTQSLVREFELPVVREGSCQLVMVWWDADLDDEGREKMSTDPFGTRLSTFRHGHWAPRGQVLPLGPSADKAALEVKKGDKLRVTIVLKQDRPDPQPYFSVVPIQRI